MLKSRKRRIISPLVADSPLRKFDPRTKIAMGLCASLAVMLPLDRLVWFMAGYLILFWWARLLPRAALQVWRIKWVLIILLLVDWWLVDLNLALLVTLRIILLASVFALLFSTTTQTEFNLALERLHVPYRFAFSLSLAFQSLDILGDEWQAIREAQHARGITINATGVKKVAHQLRELAALAIPAIVMTTKRAWFVTEAAYARGFDSPKRRPYYVIKMAWFDWALLCGSLALAGFLLWS
jgi:energy-coupling factor transporter transmembrane protein EcfT